MKQKQTKAKRKVQHLNSNKNPKTKRKAAGINADKIGISFSETSKAMGLFRHKNNQQGSKNKSRIEGHQNQVSRSTKTAMGN